MPTLVPISVGAGRDYSTLQNAWDNIDTEATGSTGDLVTNDENVVITCFDDESHASTFSFAVTAGYTTSDTNDIVIRGDGYTDGTSGGTGITLTHTGSGSQVALTQNYVRFEDLRFVCPNNFQNTVNLLTNTSNNREGVQFRRCVFAPSNTSVYGIGGGNISYGSATDRVVLQNCVFYNCRAALFVSSSSAVTWYFDLVGCTWGEGANQLYGIWWNGGNAAETFNLRMVNNLCLEGSTADFRRQTAGTGTLTTTGSTNNFGPEATAADQFPGLGTPNPITPVTTVTDSAGEAGYTSSTDATLIDDPDNNILLQGVGPASDSLVPNIDILGNERYGTVTDPGAFIVSTIPATVAITAGSGQDYSNTQNAIDNVTTEAIDGNLVANRQAVTITTVDDEISITSSLLVNESLTTDATYNLTIEANTFSNGVRYNFGTGTGTAVTQTSGPVIMWDIRDAHTTVRGFTIQNYGTYEAGACFGCGSGSAPAGVRFERITVDGVGNFAYGLNVGSIVDVGTATYPWVFENCVFYDLLYFTRYNQFSVASSGNDVYLDIVNCSFGPNATAGGSPEGLFRINAVANQTFNLRVVNCVNFSDAYTTGELRDEGGAGTITTTGSANNLSAETTAADRLPGAVSPFDPGTPNTAVTGGTDDMTYTSDENYLPVDNASNDMLGKGVGPASNSLVPDIDILGNTRVGTTTDPGAFQVSAPPGGGVPFSMSATLRRNVRL